MAFVRRKGNSLLFWCAIVAAEGGKVRHFGVRAVLTNKGRITDRVSEISKKHPFVELTALSTSPPKK